MRLRAATLWLAFGLLGAAVQGASVRAEGGDKGKEADQDKDVKIDYNDPAEAEAGKKQEVEDFPYAPPIEQIFQNPAFQANLASGADALNKSVETLMDAVFYQLLVNERNFDLTHDAWFNAALKRNIYTAPSGAYVIVDRFLLGPRYAKELWRVQNIPVTLGIDGSVEVLQIYLRTDGMRLAEQQDLTPWRRLVNNWFGLIPLMGMVLPPSFNQNALYDPLTELQTPFSFPLDMDKFESMPIGSIRSYAISGGIRLSPDFGGLLDRSTQDNLDRIGGLQEGIPYSIFKRGEHRINVLRRGDHTAWVGVTDLNRTGHGINPLVGQKYYVLRGMLAANIVKYKWIWAGVPVAVLPLNLDFEQAFVDLFDQVYEYDLTRPAAQEAYAAAVKGDFVPSHDRYLDAKERQLDTGVTFHFARQQDRTETVSSNGPNVAVYKKERRRDHNEAEVEITDQEGKFYVLESNLDVSDRTWNVLVGEDETRSQQSIEMKVKRVQNRDNPNDPKDFTYAFEVDPDPYRLTMALNIQDKYVDTVQYGRYIDLLRFFTGMPLRDVPVMDVREPEALRQWHKDGYFLDPREQNAFIHVTPTYLGKFGAQAALSFSAKELLKIIHSSEDDIWAAFARAYGLDEASWRSAAQRQTFGFQAQWFQALLAYPLRIFNVRYPAADAVVEAQNAVDQLLALRALKKPLPMLDAFFDLLDSDHPQELCRALLELADLEQVPRKVTFSAQPKGGSPEVKDKYGKLNAVTYRAGPAFPDPGRYTRAKAKLSSFYLDQPREAESRPHIAKIQVVTKEVPASVRQLATSPEDLDDEDPINRIARHVFVTFSVRDAITDFPIKVYVKVEQAGKVKLGKLALAEKVLELSQVDNKLGGAGINTYEFFLTGPMSPLSNFLFNQAVGAGDEFQVTMSVSKDGAVWSEERTMEFRFEGGNLYPIK